MEPSWSRGTGPSSSFFYVWQFIGIAILEPDFFLTKEGLVWIV